MSDHIVVRIRGTFIDVEANDWNVQPKTRSCSVPASRGVRHSPAVGDSPEFKYLASWIENANLLPHSAPNSPKKLGDTTPETFDAGSICTLDSFDSLAPETPSTLDLPMTEPVFFPMQLPSEDSTMVPSITTMMICDIPCRQNINQLIDVINEHGFSGTYDLVYMPPQKGFRRTSPKHSQNMGYAFVNFKDPTYADAFWHAFYDFTFPNCRSLKRTYSKPAHHQGYEVNLKMHTKQQSAGYLLTFD